jgi:hypothetical protein
LPAIACGFTLLFATAAAPATNPHAFKSLPYDVRDFPPVGLLARAPFIVSGEFLD